MQRRRPPPAADAGRSCWGSGLQDASAAQGTKQTQGAATRRVQRVEIAGGFLVLFCHQKRTIPARLQARRNRRALAALNMRHLLRKPVCGLKAPLGLSCPPGTAVLSGFLLGGKREHSPPSCIYTFYSTILLHNCFQFGFKSSDFLHKY